MRSFYLLYSNIGLTQAVFYEIFEFLLYWGLGFISEFARLDLCRANGHDFAKYIFYPYISLVREYCSVAPPPAKVEAAHCRRKKAPFLLTP